MCRPWGFLFVSLITGVSRVFAVYVKKRWVGALVRNLCTNREHTLKYPTRFPETIWQIIKNNSHIPEFRDRVIQNPEQVQTVQFLTHFLFDSRKKSNTFSPLSIEDFFRRLLQMSKDFSFLSDHYAAIKAFAKNQHPTETSNGNKRCIRVLEKFSQHRFVFAKSSLISVARRYGHHDWEVIRRCNYRCCHAIFKKKKKSKCSRCKAAYYCCRKCQKKDWKARHRFVCNA